MSEILKSEAISLFDQGIKVFLSDPNTRLAIRPFSEFDPIHDRETLVRECTANPRANLEIVVGKDEGLLALVVGVGEGNENGESSLNALCERYGAPNTLTYVTPTGEQCFLFKFDRKAFMPARDSGLRLETSTVSLLVFPSLIRGKPVEKRGSAALQRLSAWLGDGDAPVVMASEPVAKAAEVRPEEVEVEKIAASRDDPAGEEMVTHLLSAQGVLLNQAPAVNATPIDVLRGEIASWAADGDEKSVLLRKALEWNDAMGLLVKTDEVVRLVDKLGGTDAVAIESLAGEDLLFKLAEGAILFHDGLSVPYFFEGRPFKAPSKEYAAQLKYRYYQRKKSMPDSKQLKNVLEILQSRASFEGPQVNLRNRVSDKDGAIIYDLRDDRYLKATSTGWEIVPAYPLFYRHQHQQVQVEPASGGDPWNVFEFLPVGEEHRLLIMVYLISLFVPRIAHPVLAVFGDQGSAKSSFCAIINKLVDPTLTERVILQKNARDMIQTLKQKYVTIFDNLSIINDQVSDVFCQVCTGASISYRSLYTDEGENIAQFKHVIILNSISLAIANADLMDRSIIIKCHRIKPEDRRPEDELWEAFEKAKPGILGGIFDTLVRAMEIFPTLKIDKLPRLADFAKWGYAIAEALGQSGEKFIEDFSQNVKRQNENVAEKNVLCQAMLQLMSDKEVFLKTVGDAHAALKNIAGADAKDETFPKRPHLLRKGLESLRTTLAEHNIVFQFISQRESVGVKILFSKTASSATSRDEGPAPERQEITICVPNVPDEAQGAIPVVELDEMPEAVNE